MFDRPVMDASGRYVAFLSSATNLTTNTLVGDINLYRRDVETGTTVLVDTDTNGVGSGVTLTTVPQVSSNGQVIAFESVSASIAANDFNHNFDVFVLDFASGGVEFSSMRPPASLSLTPDGASKLGPSATSADSRYVVFSSEADNVVAKDTNGFRDVFVRDQIVGTNLLISVATNGSPGDGISDEPSMSSDGCFVAFTSRADNLVSGDLNNRLDVFLRDRLNGSTSLVSVSTNGVNSGNDHSYGPSLSADARVVLFRSTAKNLAMGSFTLENLFLRDLQSSATYSLTLGGVSGATMNADGRFVLFAGALAVSNSPYLYLWDSQSNSIIYTNNLVVTTPTSVGVSPDGNRLAFTSSNQLFVVDRTANTNWSIGNPMASSRNGMVFSGDGRFLIYAGLTSPEATNQVYTYDFQAGINRMISSGFNGTDPGNDDSDSPAISSDNRFVAFRSAASNLVPNDANGAADIFLYDLATGSTTLVSASGNGDRSADGYSLRPFFTGDGSRLLLQSWSTDLLSGDANAVADIFAYALPEPSAAQPFSATALRDYELPGAVWIRWLAVPVVSYRVQFKDNLGNSQWQELGGAVKIVGTQGFLRDLPTQGSQRFYRVVAF
jgi:Tol biopolymer transport system component